MPSLNVSDHSTSSEDDGSDCENQDNLYLVDTVYAKKTNVEGAIFYLVSWVGYERLALQPAEDLPHNVIAEFDQEELGTV
ncbi:hypothetical protein L914_02382 [Phytophthora nicotianae]|uniref:Chromo domain-containing protein n=1 Tax=Phytophthora nicotianae TaxID=4792 RepID=W2JQD1_PHYNI|nr:hypothetical protein L916_02358 [Phytophthora nicotianae]ETM54266.1 hypothetical protein L914_02382 [Phytophthora nicotianae]